MKNLIDTIKNIWRIEELRNRILITLGLLLVYRIGSFIVLPGVDSSLISSDASGGGGIVEILAIFTGGAFTRASIFALGIMPYISASIIMQLMGIAVPSVQKMQREESGRRKINQWTRYLTILICLFQAPSYILATIEPEAYPSDSQFWLMTSIVILTASTLFVMWLGERITERGLGNGISLIIMIGILAQFPQSFAQEVVGRMAAGPGSKVYGRLSVMLQAYCRVTPLFKVPPGAFRPAPKVDSAVVRLQPLPPAEVAVADRARFAHVVRAAFGQRRKTLRNALSGVVDAAAIEAAGLRPDARAEQLSVAEFAALADTAAAGTD